MQPATNTMPEPGQQLRSFLRAVHLRLIVLRFVESIGGGVVAGSIAALPLVAIQLWRGEPALPAAVLLMLVGAAGGMLFALRTWPNRFTAAHQADEQLKLTDLLSTSFAMQDLQDDPWAMSVLAMAEARCRELSPSDLVLHRWGVRAWGGIGLFAALVLAVSLLGSDPNPLRATENAASMRSTRIPQQAEVPDSRNSSLPDDSPSRANRANSPTESATERNFQQNASGDIAQNLRDGAPQNGEGTGATDSSDVPPIPRISDVSEPETPGVVPGTGGDASVDAEGGLSGTPGSDGGNGNSSDVPAWESQTWPEDRDRALRAVRDGEIPDAYRDLVRHYFSPDRP